MKNIYITSAEAATGKSIIALGLMRSLLQRVPKVAFFRPVLQPAVSNNASDADIDLILDYFQLEMNPEQAYGVSHTKARELLSAGRQSDLLDEVLFKYKQLEQHYDFILCEGTDFTGPDTAFEFELNTEIAANLGGAVLTVISGHQRSAAEIAETARLTLNILAAKNLDNFALLVNRCTLPSKENKKLLQNLRAIPFKSPVYGEAYGLADNSTSGRSAVKQDSHSTSPVFVLPENSLLCRPSLQDVCQHLNARYLTPAAQTGNLAEHFLVAAGSPENFVADLKPATLALLAPERSDIVLAALAAHASPSCPPLAGLLFCGPGKPSGKSPATILKLLKNQTEPYLPVLSCPLDILQASQRLASLKSKLTSADLPKIALALKLFEQHVPTAHLGKQIIKANSSKITPKMFELKLFDLARRKKMHIVLPEGTEERTLLAAADLRAHGVARLTLLGSKSEITSKARQLNLDIKAARLLNPASSPDLGRYAKAYYELRKDKGMTLEHANELLLDPVYFGTMLLKAGEVDGLVCGAAHTTAHTLRPAFEIIKTRLGVKIASSVFFMCLQNKVLVFGDCAVNVDPTSEELADIAISSAHTAALFGVAPKVAMLSYSTGQSGKGEEVDKVTKATKIARQKAPKLLLDGPLQYDAATDPTVATLKAPHSKVAGEATVLIFPDLNTGNNTYKAVQRSAGAVAIGPIIQGLNKPVNDLSRGATVEDIVNTIAITAIQAQALKS